MHKHEYNASLAYAYIDEHDFNVDSITALTTRDLNLKLMAVLHTDDREFLAFVRESELQGSRLKPNDPLKYTVTDVRIIDANTSDANEKSAAGHDQMEGIDDMASKSNEPSPPTAEEGPVRDEDEESESVEKVADDDEQGPHMDQSRPISAEDIERFEHASNIPKAARPQSPTPPKPNQGWKVLYMIRPYGEEAKTWERNAEINTLSWKVLLNSNFAQILEDHPAHIVFVSIDIGQKERKQILAANHELYMRCDSMTDLWNLLLMQQHSTFPHVDIYRTVPEEAVSSASFTQKLSHGQKAAFNALRNMPAFAVALHGPPGTGETYWASKIIILLVQHANKETGEQNLIYCMAATNEQADRFIEEIDHSLGEYVHREKEKPGTIVRLLPWHVEGHLYPNEVR
ncbi:uncharacterized protein N7469_003182 [Penicillium citrinum]|uniref:DNA2/NAM7 helicase helicase domain-containing protein n=1 Tax=Penicillium citrinum TaxID=5077 RepID=A0A9W9PBS4_PENCI|nr:uncharacterized protein N7469_003182 [Penicillium citrinum]KAJ5241591.1 hypothetical protein N7469_003182 [Penicillium citrinum]